MLPLSAYNAPEIKAIILEDTSSGKSAKLTIIGSFLLKKAYITLFGVFFDGIMAIRPHFQIGFQFFHFVCFVVMDKL